MQNKADTLMWAQSRAAGSNKALLLSSDVELNDLQVK